MFGENARLFALVNLAMADGYIAGFEDKYYYNYWRPVTAIRERGDSEWLSYLPTPPVPDYPSNHTIEGAAAVNGNGPVLQHRLRQFLDDQRCPLSGHHPQVLELLGSSARKWCVPCPLRNSLLDRGERPLFPGRTHWGMGFRKRIAACEASADDQRFLRVRKNGTLKPRSSRNDGSVLGVVGN